MNWQTGSAAGPERAPLGGFDDKDHRQPRGELGGAVADMLRQAVGNGRGRRGPRRVSGS